MKSVMSHKFSQVPKVDIPRSKFNRSHGYKTCFDAGYLVPILVDEVLPGDTFNVNMTAFSRMSTPIFPVMDNMYMDTQFFSVPMRLVWNNFQRFMGERDPDPDSSTDYTMPVFDITKPPLSGVGYTEGSLSDYMGIPTKVGSLEHSSLFHRAYNLIYNEWYRDQNLQDSVVVDKDDGPDDPADYVLLKRGKRHDYFTSCLPWPQKGDSIDLPLGTKAPLAAETGISASANLDVVSTGASNELYGDTVATGQGATRVLYADLSTATAATINQLRQSFQIQKLLERDARGGTRYTEIVKSHFGVTSPDARLQRPEYLGGGSTPVNINPIVQTASTQYPDASQDGAMGQPGAYVTTAIRNNGFTKSFTEHCIIIGLVSVRADLTYQQGLNRMFSRSTRYDMYFPTLSHIGEQSVLNKEIYAQGIAADDSVFGYQERYAEFRYKPSQVTGLFRSNATATLDSWHLSQEFGSLPLLDATFIEEDPPVDRVVATSTEPQFIFDSYFSMQCARPMPLYGVPGMIDHF